MTKEQSDKFKQLGYEIISDYSPRGYYGKTVYAVKINSFTDLIIDIIENAEFFVGFELKNLSSDTLGFNYIIY